VGLERGPLSFVSATEELLGRKSSGSGLESRKYGCKYPSRSPRGTLYPQKVGTNFADRPRSLFDSKNRQTPAETGAGVYGDGLQCFWNGQ
jgi:hypothetical protein